ncbi:MOSC domain-containing protein [Mycolicibacter arupensis]|uniref:MOSC domain-containing protein n=1 Tax=Mycolicibacter arupensis TaxID=342002 RepID=UPI00122C4553|nr:MOSC domain-containing protein [Mycolicibacter arupensis]KAA1431830.1 MOSC domain-containing protein [Mycolicibacter arupensis]
MIDVSADDGVVGRIQTIFRFPIKSVGGHTLNETYIDTHGAVGDHRYAFIDIETGHLCNAKNPRKFGAMLACRARYLDEPQPGQELPTLEVVFPDGSVHRNLGNDLDAAMSAYLGRPVRLADTVPADAATELVWEATTGLPKAGVYSHTTTNADGDEVLTYGPLQAHRFFDLTPLHFITTATIAHLRGLEPGANFNPRRYRPTMVIDTPAAGLVEDSWLGGRLSIGSDCKASVDMWTPRCVMSTLAHGKDVPLDRATLRTIAKHNSKAIPNLGRLACAGVYANVLATGLVRVGDSVRYEPEPNPAEENTA